MANCILTACEKTMADYKASTKEMKEMFECHTDKMRKHVLPSLVAITRDPTNMLTVTSAVAEILSNKEFIREVNALVKKMKKILEKRNAQKKDIINCFLSNCDAEGILVVERLLTIYLALRDIFTGMDKFLKEHIQELDTTIRYVKLSLKKHKAKKH